MTPDLEKLLELALKAGASEAEVYYSRLLSHPVFFEANRLKQLESSESEGMALRVWRGGQPGLAVAYGPVDPETLVAKAMELSSLNPAEDLILTPARHDHREPVGSPVAVQTLVELGKMAIAELRDDYPEVLCGGELSCETETTRLLNSHGLDCQTEDTSLSYYFGVEWIRGEDFLAVYDGDYSRGAVQLETVIHSLRQRLDWAKGNASPTSGKLPVLFTGNAATMLWETVSAALNGKRILDGSSPWNKKQGELVLAKEITLWQDPRLSPYDCPFDDEGTLTQPLSLVSQGVIEQFYLDRTTAHGLGQAPSGNGFRPGLEYYPVPSLVNMVVESGEGTIKTLIQPLTRGLVVDQLLGGGADISGDFSVNVDLGYAVENGEIIGRVKDTMISGNVYRLLQQVLALGGDRRWQGSCFTPSLLIDGVSVVA